MIVAWGRLPFQRQKRPRDTRPMDMRDALLIVNGRPVRYRRAEVTIETGEPRAHVSGNGMVMFADRPDRHIAVQTTGRQIMTGDIGTLTLSRRRSGRLCVAVSGGSITTQGTTAILGMPADAYIEWASR